MISSSAKARYDDLRSLAFGSITGTYAGVGAPFANPVRILKVFNTSDQGILVSFNGINDKDFVASGSGYVYDYASNKIGPVEQLEQPAGDRFYVKSAGSNPTLGAVYVTVIYASPV